jgi:hypothetical protein
MSTLHRWLLIGAALLCAGCGDPRHQTQRTLGQAGIAPLRHDAALFYKDLFVTPENRDFVLKLDKCPASFQRFQPLRVRAYPDGFALAIREARGDEEGLYVVPDGMDLELRSGHSAQFEKMADGIYWYRFTR